MSFVARHPLRIVMRGHAIRLTKSCRRLVQHQFDEADWAALDAALFEVIHAELQAFTANCRLKLACPEQIEHCP